MRWSKERFSNIRMMIVWILEMSFMEAWWSDEVLEKWVSAPGVAVSWGRLEDAENGLSELAGAFDVRVAGGGAVAGFPQDEVGLIEIAGGVARRSDGIFGRKVGVEPPEPGLRGKSGVIVAEGSFGV